MAKVEEARSRRVSEAGTREATFGTGLDPLIQLSNKLLEGWMAVSNEMLEFSKNRFDRGIEMSKAIAQSSSFNEAIDLQTQYTRSIVQDYVSEANKIVDLSARSFMDTLSTLQPQSRGTTH